MSRFYIKSVGASGPKVEYSQVTLMQKSILNTDRQTPVNLMELIQWFGNTRDSPYHMVRTSLKGISFSE